MRTLVYDTEMEPAVAYLWDLRIQGGYVPHTNVIKPKKLLCVAAKFVGEDKIYFFSSWEHGMQGMCQGIWDLLDQCDVAVHYNGCRADEKWLHTEFVKLGMGMPSGYITTDLYRVVKRRFNFMSSSLAYVTKELGVRHKSDSGGMQTWVDVMNGDQDAQDHMREYNINDVYATEALFERLKPWVPNAPNAALIDGDVSDCCPRCKSTDYAARGWVYLATGAYKRYKCRSCLHYFRSRTRTLASEFRTVNQ